MENPHAKKLKQLGIKASSQQVATSRPATISIIQMRLPMPTARRKWALRSLRRYPQSPRRIWRARQTGRAGSFGAPIADTNIGFRPVPAQEGISGYRTAPVGQDAIAPAPGGGASAPAGSLGASSGAAPSGSASLASLSSQVVTYQGSGLGRPPH